MAGNGDNVIQGDFSALGHAGSGHYVGLEIISLSEEMQYVSFNSDEFTAVCPVTGQPDQYELEITLNDTSYSIESKSLKIYLNSFRNEGCFAENLACRIKDDIVRAIDGYIALNGGPIFTDGRVEVIIYQKRRGGISIEAKA